MSILDHFMSVFHDKDLQVWSIISIWHAEKLKISNAYQEYVNMFIILLYNTLIYSHR